MSHTVTVGLDGSRESEAALDWAAREALRRDAELDIAWHAATPTCGPRPITTPDARRRFSSRSAKAPISWSSAPAVSGR